jgi:hypothetical protein
LGNAELDWNKLELPSDALTVGAIRRAHADIFSQNTHGISEPLIKILAFDILSNEMDLAALAFAEKTAQPRPDVLVSREDIIQALMDDYATAGIGSGPASRQALIRKIETDVASLAQLAMGSTRA